MMVISAFVATVLLSTLTSAVQVGSPVTPSVIITNAITGEPVSAFDERISTLHIYFEVDHRPYTVELSDVTSSTNSNTYVEGFVDSEGRIEFPHSVEQPKLMTQSFQGFVLDEPGSIATLNVELKSRRILASVIIPSQHFATEITATLSTDDKLPSMHSVSVLVSNLPSGTLTTETANVSDVIWQSGISRRRRSTCRKIMRLLVINDDSMFDEYGDGTNSYSSQVVNSVSSLFQDSNFNCSIDLELVGQVTFKYEMPQEIVQQSCDQEWYFDSLPDTASDSCCGSENPCSDCPQGTSMCLSRDLRCENVTRGCFDKTNTRTEVCPNNIVRTTIYQEAENDLCRPRSTSLREYDADTMLTTLGSWLAEHDGQLRSAFGSNIDNVALFTRRNLPGAITGISEIGTQCSGAVVVSKSVNLIQPGSNTLNARTVAHELGHNLGLHHARESGTIMSHSNGSPGRGRDEENLHWADESVADLNALMETSLSCLDSEEHTDTYNGICGDGIVDADEECDPGISVSDSCCLQTCNLAPGCVCANHQECCRNGTFASADTVCRPSVDSICDEAEYCSGISSECPGDQQIPTGVSCGENELGSCHRGICVPPLSNKACPSWAPILCILSDEEKQCEVWCRANNSNQCFNSARLAEPGTSCGSAGHCSPQAHRQTGFACVPNNMTTSSTVRTSTETLLLQSSSLRLMIAFSESLSSFNTTESRAQIASQVERIVGTGSVVSVFSFGATVFEVVFESTVPRGTISAAASVSYSATSVRGNTLNSASVSVASKYIQGNSSVNTSSPSDDSLLNTTTLVIGGTVSAVVSVLFGLGALFLWRHNQKELAVPSKLLNWDNNSSGGRAVESSVGESVVDDNENDPMWVELDWETETK